MGGPIWGGPQGWYPQIMSKYLSLKYLLITKKTGTLVQKFDFLGGFGTPKPCLNISLLNIYVQKKKVCLKNLFFGGPFGGVPGGGVSPTDIKKNWGVVQKFDFLGPHFGGVPGGVVPPNHV